MQLLLFTATAFWLYINKLGGHATISLDTDWFYRKPGMLFLLIFRHPLQDLRFGLQSFFARTVANVISLSKNPILLPEIAIRYIHLGIINRLYHASGLSDDQLDELKRLQSRLAAIRKIAYDKDVYRRPIGFGVLLAIVLLFLYGLSYIIILL
jgi:hypothetical protein